ncbi:STAS domain-containing protein [Actinomadura sp. ATCC 31491]|uniref:STAS domain-containing protein n=1 Tax=Actinomadura luzonensis TaxID=2805427 RepID=A0ABT0FTZ4_9ACTN|nr:STAS domain-containing protein [Actinomadura luzonensis]MCK2215782.1 STAS domain-containing protein [Actinomadura luzonensis]
MSDTPLTVSVERRPRGAVALVAAGEIDMSNARAFGEALARALGEHGDSGDSGDSGNNGSDGSDGDNGERGAGRGRGGARPLEVDLTGVAYIDSAGLTFLFDHAERIEIVAGPLLGSALTVSGLTELTTVRGLGHADRP